jgi:uncharacterized protein DUF5916
MPSPRWLFGPLSLVLSTIVFAPDLASQVATPHDSVPRIAAAPLASEIKLDGRLDEAAWSASEPAALTAQLDPSEGQPPSERTEIRVLLGHDALYIGARMFDREPRRIVSRLSRRDDQPASDRFTIRLDARHDHLSGFLFDVYPAGNKGDAAIGSDGSQDYSWDPIWEVATSVDSLGWTAELRIPLSQLRYNAGADRWGIDFERFIQRKQELDVFSFVPKKDQGGVNRYGHLTGMADVTRTRRLEISPYVSARGTYAPTPAGDPFRSGHDYLGSTGADLKYGLTSDLTLDATINPDFGQVEVDPAVVNLSAFETVFSEKRPFFIEGADLFSFGVLRTFNAYGTPTTFFSRRIGRPPQGPLGGPETQFAEEPDQTTIAAAAKVTGKTRSGWSIALLDAVTPQESGRFTDGGGVIQRAPVEPLTNYFIGRVRRELRAGNTVVGGLFTAVDRHLSDSTLAGALRSDAYLGGLDLNHSWDNRSWALDASVAATTIRGSASSIALAQRSSARYYQRPDATSLAFDPTRTSLGGHAEQLAVSKVSGLHWGGNVAVQDKSPGYETNDAGLTQTVNRLSLSTDIHYQENRPGKIFRDYIIGLLSGNVWNYDGDKVQTYIGNVSNFRFRNFWRLNTYTEHDLPSFDDQLTRGGPLVRLPTRNYFNGTLSTADRGLLSLQLSGSLNWNGAGGWDRSIALRTVVHPGPNFQLSFGPSFERARNVSQFVTAVADPTAGVTFGTRSVFATLTETDVALDTRLNWTFTPKLSLQLYVQPLIVAGNYADYKELVAPRTFDFAVYGQDAGTIARDGNGNFTVDPDGAGSAAPFTIGDQNFNFRSLRANLVFRWEYRPGSTLFLVWQQQRAGVAPIGDFAFRRDFSAIFDNAATNVVAVKATYWLGF